MIKFFKLFTIIIILIALATATFIYLNKDALQKQIVEKINEQVAVPMAVDKINMQLYETFPYLSFEFQNFTIKDKLRPQKDLIKAKSIAFGFNFWEIFNEEITIQYINLKEAAIALFIDKNGKINYDILKDKESSNQFSLNTLSEIQKVRLDKVSFKYIDERKHVALPIFIDDLKTSILLKKNIPFFDLDGTVIFKKGGMSWTVPLVEKSVSLKSKFRIQQNYLLLNESTILVNKTKGTASGELPLVEGPLGFIDFKISKTDAAWVYDFIFSHDDYYKMLKKNQFKIIGSGKYKGNLLDVKTTQVFLNDVTLSQGKNKMSGKFNFLSYPKETIETDLDFKLFSDTWAKIPVLKQWAPATGHIDGHLKFKGNLKPIFAKRWTQHDANWNATIKLNQLTYSTESLPYSVEAINGLMTLVDEKLKIKNLSATYHNNVFNIDLFSYRIKSSLINRVLPPLQVKASGKVLQVQDFLYQASKSRKNDDQQINQYNESGSLSMALAAIDPLLDITLATTFDKVIQNRFVATSFKGNLQVLNKKWSINHCSFKTMQGETSVKGYIKPIQNKHLAIQFETDLKHIEIQKLFYIFKNFNQDFIRSKHLRGMLDAALSIYVELNAKDIWQPDSFLGIFNLKLKSGKLIQFEPLKKVAKYIPKANFDHLYFSDLNNKIFVDKEQVIIPKMIVGNSARNIEVQGKHSFDQHINYFIKVPITKKERITSQDEEASVKGKTSLHLRINGTIDDYKVSLDKAATKKQIQDGFFREKKEWKDRKEKGYDDKKKKIILDTLNVID